MTRACRIRFARREDAPALVPLIEALRSHQDDPPGLLGVAELERHGFGVRAEFRILVAEEPGEGSALMGYALYFDSYEPAYAACGSYLPDLYVQPGARRRGVARTLLAAVARDTRERGRTYVWWCVRETNRDAQAFYDRLGAVRASVSARALTFDRFAALADEGAQVGIA